MSEHALDELAPSVLDRTIDLSRVTWTAVGSIAVVATAAILRLAQLDRVPLSPREAAVSHAAWRFVEGQTIGPGNAVPNVGPAFLLLQSLGFFLFGASDVVARAIPALLGIGIVLLIRALTPVIGRSRALGAAALAAASPTLVFASRTSSAQIAVAFFTLLAAVALLRLSLPATARPARRRWCLIAGFAVAAGFGSGPSFLSVAIAIGIALFAVDLLENGAGPARRILLAIRADRENAVFMLAGFLVTLLSIFTYLFTDFSALAGIGETFTAWGRLIGTSAGGVPTQFFLLSVLLYELLAVVFSIVAVTRPKDPGQRLSWSFFGTWFVAALLLFSFSSGRASDQAVQVALPLVILGGAEIGAMVSAIASERRLRGQVGLLFLTILGLVIALVSLFVLIGRIDTALDRTQAILEAAAAFLLAVFPLAYVAYSLIRGPRLGGRRDLAAAAALFAVGLLLAAFGLRSAIQLSFYNAGSGTELLAQQSSTRGVEQIVWRVTNLGRDTTLKQGSARDPQGGHGLSIAIDHDVQWPYRWYFRDFPDATVVASGQAVQSSADVLIAPDDTGMAEAGYAPRLYPNTQRVPGAYAEPSISTILGDVLNPAKWGEGIDFALHRKVVTSEPSTLAVGLTANLANVVSPNSGPYSLLAHVGAGAGRGQFNQPRGIALDSTNGTSYVVDMGNARVQRFDAAGEYVGSWGGVDGGDITFELTDQGLGPTGVAVGADGLVYVCDTWNHRIVVLTPGGQLAREFGAFADAGDSADPSVQPGTFFGPRAIAVFQNEIYVVDTGNERVEVFSLDGTFVRAFGGHGAEPGKLLEPVGIAIGPDKRVYVADSGNARISVFATTGTPLGQWPVDAWAGNLYFEPYLAFDADGYLYATSSASGSVEVFDPSGAQVDSIKTVGNDALQQPVGIAPTGDGAILISDKGANAIYRYQPPDRQPQVDEDVPANGASNGSPAASPGASPVASPRQPAVPVDAVPTTPAVVPTATAVG